MGMHFEGKGSGKKNKNSGFYVAIGLCCAAVCLVAASTALNNRDKQDTPDYVAADEGGWTIDETLDAAKGDYSQDAVEADITTAATTQTTAITTTTAVPVVEASITVVDPSSDDAELLAAVSYISPMDGSVLKGFSGAELVYCSTMCDWRVHQGVDIAGETGGEVRAAANGIVVDFVEDVLYGHTAIVRQADESMLYYCGLTSEPKVSTGLEIKAGDVIGYLGDVPCEVGDGPHLHLALMRDGEFVDPASVISLG